MKTTRKLTIAGMAVAMLLAVGCAGPYVGHYGSYSGPYYGSYGPYDNSSIFLTGGYGGGYYGDHHLYGHTMGGSGGSHMASSGGGGSHGTGSHGGGGGHASHH